MNVRVCIMNYGSGNVQSVANLFEFCGANTTISNDPKEIQKATHLILPGVGAFSSAMDKIGSMLPMKSIEEEVKIKKKPFLGICVGMQVLAEQGEEFSLTRGLGWIPGKVTKLGYQPLPHIGWNSFSYVKANSMTDAIDGDADFYFAHSFVFQTRDPSKVIATTRYGIDFCSIVNHENIWGVQFHPEKSQHAGIRLVKNFLQIKGV